MFYSIKVYNEKTSRLETDNLYFVLKRKYNKISREVE